MARKKVPQSARLSAGGGPIAIWAMPKCRGRQTKWVFPYDKCDNCFYNFGTFDDFGVKNDQKSIHMTRYWCQGIRDSYMVGKRADKFGQGPPFKQCFLPGEVFPN